MRLQLFWILVMGGILLPAGCSRRVDPEMVARFQAAEEQFAVAMSPEEYLRAAALYQGLLDHGVVSGAILYNQGNAFTRAGQRGRAVACYRQAFRYLPLDPYVAANLRSVLGTDVIAPRKPLIEHVLFWQDWVGYGTKFRLSLIAAGATFVMASIRLFFRRRFWRHVSLTLLLLTGALCASAGYDWYRFDHLRHGTLIRDDVVARKGNAESYEPAFQERLKETAEFVVVELRGGWMHVRLPSDQLAWIEAKDAVVY